MAASTLGIIKSSLSCKTYPNMLLGSAQLWKAKTTACKQRVHGGILPWFPTAQTHNAEQTTRRIILLPLPPILTLWLSVALYVKAILHQSDTNSQRVNPFAAGGQTRALEHHRAMSTNSPSHTHRHQSTTAALGLSQLGGVSFSTVGQGPRAHDGCRGPEDVLLLGLSAVTG